jgi:hypothetical protein
VTDLDQATAERRAARLIRWYPRSWRDRYGDEFAALLADDILDRGRSWRRSADVARCGLLARASAAGLAAGPVQSTAGTTATTLGWLLIGGAALVSVWSQLVRGLPAASTASTAEPMRVGAVVISILVVSALIVVLVGTQRVLGDLIAAVRRESRRASIAVALMVTGYGGLLLGGAVLSGRYAAGVPGSAARLVGFGRAETLSISAFWVHPTRLATVEPVALAWMFVSPALLVVAIAGTSRLLALLPASAVDRTATTVRRVAVAGLVTLPVGAWWVVTSQHAAVPTARAGTLDLALVSLMVGAFAGAIVVGRRARASLGD